MIHQSQETLYQQLQETAAQISVNGLYRHYKDPRSSYRVDQLVIHEADQTVQVVYESMHDNHIRYVRSAASWLLPVVIDGEVIERYSLIE